MPNEDSISASLEAVLARYGERVRHAGRQYGLQSADIDEVVQDVRIRLWRALSSEKGIAGAPASYVYRTALTAALDLLRRRRAKREVPIEAEALTMKAARLSSTEHRAERNELLERIESAVDGLVESRRPIVRMWLAGFDLAEIMNAFRYSEPKARNLLYRGLADLRTRLMELGIGPETLS